MRSIRVPGSDRRPEDREVSLLVPDRSFTPRELHLKAISVADQLERLAVSSRDGAPTRAREVGVVTAAAAELRRRIEETAADPHLGDDAAIGRLADARNEIVRALEFVLELADRVPVGPTGPGTGGVTPGP